MSTNLPVFFGSAHTHTRTHTKTRTHKHAHAHTHTHTHTQFGSLKHCLNVEHICLVRTQSPNSLTHHCTALSSKRSGGSLFSFPLGLKHIVNQSTHTYLDKKGLRRATNGQIQRTLGKMCCERADGKTLSLITPPPNLLSTSAPSSLEDKRFTFSVSCTWISLSLHLNMLLKSQKGPLKQQMLKIKTLFKWLLHWEQGVEGEGEKNKRDVQTDKKGEGYKIN